MSNFKKENCEGVLSKKNEIFESIKSFVNNRSPGDDLTSNDDLTKEFYYTFWDQIKQPFMDSMSKYKRVKHLSSLKKQAIIKLL